MSHGLGKPKEIWKKMNRVHCVKSVRIQSFSGPYFPVFGLNTERYGVSLQYGEILRISQYGEILRISPYSVRMRENTDQKNSKYGHFSRNGNLSEKNILESICHAIGNDACGNIANKELRHFRITGVALIF